jgi:RNA polymerase sigma-70 factor (ECF subfamily)
LLAALAALPQREQEVVALKFASGLTNRRIAEIVGLKPGHVGVILYRAIRKLRDHLIEGNEP